MKKEELELNAADLIDWVSKQKVLYAGRSGGNKPLLQLYAHLYGGFSVEVNGETVWKGIGNYISVRPKK